MILFLTLLIVLVPKQTIAVPMLDWMSWLGVARQFVFPAVARSGYRIRSFVFLANLSTVPTGMDRLGNIGGNEYAANLCLFASFNYARSDYLFLSTFRTVLSRASLPLLLLNDQNMTLPLALAKLKDSSHRIPESVGMVVATLSLIPVLGLFVLVFSKMKTALKEVTLS